ncbi:hypothetical protein PI125_g15843, partial [Phytophthora idaei]
TGVTEVTEVTTETVEVTEEVPATTEETTEVAEVTTETIEVTDVKPEETTEVTEVTTTEIVEETVEETEVTEGKKPKSKKNRKPKRKPTAGTTEEETTEVTGVTEVTEVTTETVEVTEEVPATTEETTEVAEVTTETIEVTDVKPEETTEVTEVTTTEIVEETVEETEVTEGKKPKSKKNRKPKRKPTDTVSREKIRNDTCVTSFAAACTSVAGVTLISSSTKEETDEDGAAGATVKTEVFRTTGVNGSIITKTVRTTIRKVITSSGVVKRMIVVQTTTVTKTASGETSTAVETETREENDVESVGLINIASVVGTDGSKRSVMESNWEEKSAVLMDQRTGKGSALWDMKRRRLVKTWLPQFVSYVQRRGRSLSKAMPRKELLNFARDFCDQNFVSFEDGFFNTGTYEEKRATWTIARSLSFHYPGVAVQQLGLGVGKFQRTLLIDEVCRTRNGPDGTPLMEVEFVLSALQVVPKKCAYYEDVLILENGEVLFHATGESLITYFQELGFVCAADVKVSDYLLNLTEEQQIHHQVTMIQGFNNQRQLRRSRMFSGLMKFADDMVLITGGPGAGVQSRTSTPVGSPVRSGSTARLSTSYSPLRRQLKARGSLIRSPFGSPISSPAGFMSPQSTNATRSMKITAYSSPESKKTTKSMSSSGAGFASPLVTKTTRGAAQTTTYASPVRTQSTAMAGSTTTRKITIEGDFTVITTEVTSPHGTKRVSTTRQPTKSGSSTTAA